MARTTINSAPDKTLPASYDFSERDAFSPVGLEWNNTTLWSADQYDARVYAYVAHQSIRGKRLAVVGPAPRRSRLAAGTGQFARPRAVVLDRDRDVVGGGRRDRHGVCLPAPRGAEPGAVARAPAAHFVSGAQRECRGGGRIGGLRGPGGRHVGVRCGVVGHDPRDGECHRVGRDGHPGGDGEAR